MAVSQYPTQFNAAHSGEAVAGPPPLKVQEIAPEYPAVIFNEMVDGGGTYGADSTNRVRRFKLHYDGLTYAQAKVLDDHYAEAKSTLLGFSYRHQRATASIDELVTDCHYESFEADHGAQFNSTQTRTITLVKRPG